jgi:gliding motility-associated-like protein
MKKLFFIGFLWLILAMQAKGQNEENIWTFGSRAGLDFTTLLPTSSPNNLFPGLGGGASICNASGQLLFYSNGFWVWDRDHHIMPELTGGISGYTMPTATSVGYPPLMPWIGGHATQEAAICNAPGQQGKYYLFSLCNNGQLFYSMIDMNLNAGKGGIINGKKGIFITGNLAEKMTVVKGCNNNWLVVRSLNHNQYQAYEINDTGIITTPVISSVGQLPVSWYKCGVIKFSPNGLKMIAACNQSNKNIGGLELYDFNPITGILSNATVLDSSSTLGYYYGACFSPDNTKLYASTSAFAHGGIFYYGKVRQFNLSLPTFPAIIASNTVVYADNVYQPGFLGDLKRGKDGKIYVGGGNPSSGFPFMHIINTPNNAGAACGFIPNSLTMPPGMWSGKGLPNDIAILPAPDTLETKHPISICFRDSVLLIADTGKRYNWSNGSTGRQITVTNNGSYIVRYINAACQYAIDTYSVHFYKLPAIGTTGYSCSGKRQGIAWCNTPAGDTSTFLYTWKDASNNIIQQHWSNQGDTLRGLDTGRYAVQVTTQNGCDTTLYTTILPLPTPQIAIMADSTGCVGAAVQFTGATDAPVWSWQFGDGNTSTVLNPDYYYRRIGTYTVSFIATNIEGCSDTTSKTITIKELDIKLTADKDLVNVGELVHLRTSANEPYAILAWEPAYLLPNQTASAQTLPLDTTQIFTVTGRSAYGCIGKASIQVAVTPNVFMPNAFTPNNDGVNDRFRPVATGYIFVRYFEIYNRYGQMVYSAQGHNIAGWDGTFNGQPMELGTYYYHINIETKENKTISLKGDVILLR